jgi:hypothetical protein
VNTRRAAALNRAIASLDEETSRIAGQRARLQRELAEALEDPEEAPAAVRRVRGVGALLKPPDELDRRRAKMAHEGPR